ncbi:hypothetical protein QUB80_09400 [Chlorogloeopsis sp. ULAP01]|nr:hypothetical protein [Chlorogloeopsis sp. ULAP01]
MNFRAIALPLLYELWLGTLPITLYYSPEAALVQLLIYSIA